MRQRPARSPARAPWRGGNEDPGKGIDSRGAVQVAGEGEADAGSCVWGRTRGGRRSGRGGWRRWEIEERGGGSSQSSWHDACVERRRTGTRGRDGDRVEGIGVARVMELVGRLGLRGQRWGGPREAQVGCGWPEVQLGLNGLLGTLSPTQKRKKQR